MFPQNITLIGNQGLHVFFTNKKIESLHYQFYILHTKSVLHIIYLDDF
jgi:hypothetical protein